MARTDIRIRVRGGVIRVRIGEACIRTVIRITAEQNTTRTTNLFIALLLEVEPISVGSERHFARKRVTLLYLLQNVQDFSRAGEKLLRR